MATGDCYVVAATLVVDDGSGHLILCHGTAHGTGGEALGVDYGHAWVEFLIGGAWFVIDQSNGNHHIGPRDRYYAAGTIRDVRRYDREEAMLKMLETGHYGPWE